MSRKSLHQLYAEHTGKVSDKWSLYLTEYDRLFDDYRDKPVRLLEIGIQNGGSLEIWSKYFSNASALIGCDINPDCARLSYDDPCIVVIVGDANAPNVREQVLLHSPQFDIIIDDGSHLSNDIIKSFALYFPRIAENGVFIAEDLHCSYWSQFEGGLFDPYSSISFFKRLADVINHEHWGIPKARADILRGIFTKHGCEVDAEALAQVHSVEFINSMCVVRKAPAADNGLSRRVIAGTIELVVPGLDGKTHESDPIFDQSHNPWSARITPPDEAIESTELALANAQQQIADLYNSNSWRITRPLRFLKRQMKRVRRIAQLAMPAIKRGGGLKNTLKKAMQLYRREGLAGIRRGFRIVASSTPGSGEYGRNDYAEWIRSYDTVTDETRVTIRTRIDTFVHKPLISVVMPVYNPPLNMLEDAIRSVQNQLYPNWELCIADDASTDVDLQKLLKHFAENDSRIKVVFRKTNGHISAASNSALQLASGEFVALFDNDDLLREQALFWVANAIVTNPDAGLIYSDEDKIDQSGRRYDPYFKSDWNPDLFLSHNMICHLGVYRADLVRKLGGFREGYEGAQDYDLALRCTEQLAPQQIVHIPRVLYHWRSHAGSTAQAGSEKNYALLAGERALNDHFARVNVSAKAELLDFSMYRSRYAIPAPMPLVSLIIPTRNGLDLIKQCIESIFAKTTYKNYEILIVDNNSDDPKTLDYFASLAGDDRIRILRDERPFNYSALNNAAAQQARGEYLGLINNDIEVISPEWLEEMIGLALQPGVGAVGARLWYPNDTLQHGGVITGLGGVAGHSHKHLHKGAPGFFYRAQLIQTMSVVTAACLVVKKSIYQEVGGLDEVNLKVAFNDVDFCLRVREAGYRNIWSPYAELYHHESATRGYEDTPEKQLRFSDEVLYIKKRWGDSLLNDPAYSPNLTLDREDFSYAWPPRVEH
jgi:glycosyltransferase involved in cell wall biosynthesis